MSADIESMVMEAWHEHYASLVINCMNLESVHATIHVTEENHAPTILNPYQRHLAYFPAPVAAAVTKTLTESVSISIALAFDHGKNSDCIHQAFRAGFSGLVIDVSAFPLEENMRQVRVAVEPAVSVQLCVEGELGHLVGAPRYDQVVNTDMMAQPTDVGPFIMQTGIDLLAISVGTTHGMYTSDVVPVIGFQCLAETSHYSSAPLTLHGGNGTPLDRLQLYTALGVVKINMRMAIFEREKPVLLRTLRHDISIELMNALKAMELALEEVVTPYLQMSGPIGKV